MTIPSSSGDIFKFNEIQTEDITKERRCMRFAKEIKFMHRQNVERFDFIPIAQLKVLIFYLSRDLSSHFLRGTLRNYFIITLKTKLQFALQINVEIYDTELYTFNIRI